MIDRPRHDFLTNKLDPDLLSTPYKIQTNWHVITGAPSCGKSTLINLLSDEGFNTVPESARQYMEREVARGRSLEEIHADAAALQRGIKDIQLEIERGLRADDFAFLDRAVPDTLAWYRIFGLDPNEFLRECFHHRYASVFILDRLPIQLNGFRFEDIDNTGFFDELHVRDYRALGYSIIRVPVLSPEERLAFVLKVLSEQGLM